MYSANQPFFSSPARTAEGAAFIKKSMRFISYCTPKGKRIPPDVFSVMLMKIPAPVKRNILP